MTPSKHALSDTCDTLEKVAIIGMSCRLPGANDYATYWRNLCEAKESITRFSSQQLLAMGVPPELVQQSAYVAANGSLEDIEVFDADFFSMSPREAEITDPQHRQFLQCAWHAMEDGGYGPGAGKDTVFTSAAKSQAVEGDHGSEQNQNVAVFCGASPSAYLWGHLLNRPELAAKVSEFQLLMGNSPDYLATKTAYKLMLKGPAVQLGSACSTSLVAVHMACQSLLDYQCDMALAGGVSLQLPWQTGYLYQTDSILSDDGHCRPFDESANGTVNGSGCAVVLLKRLSEALADGDTVHAIIAGSAVNNDGAQKVGYTAPSVEGQARVIRRALAEARVRAEDIQFIEAHGTATKLGDPIEVAALKQVFNKADNRCALGSVKSNVGHLDGVAGIAGLIKTVLALKYAAIPATLHFNQANPRCGLADSPFYVNADLLSWPSSAGPRCAGVSSFGIGGTNAHVILQSASESPALSGSAKTCPSGLSTSASRQGQKSASKLSVLVTAKTKPALKRMVGALKNTVDKGHCDLDALAYTLMHGRAHFHYAYCVEVKDRDELSVALGEFTDSQIKRIDEVRACLSEDSMPRQQRRIPLPGYSFDPKRHWIERAAAAEPLTAQSPEAEDPSSLCTPVERYFYSPSWTRLSPLNAREHVPRCCFIVSDNAQRSSVEALSGEAVIPYDALARALNEDEFFACNRAETIRFIYLAASNVSEPCLDHMHYTVLLAIARQLHGQFEGTVKRCELLILTRNAYSVTGSETVDARQAILRGPSMVIPQEYADIQCQLMDIGALSLRDALFFILAPWWYIGKSPLALREKFAWRYGFVPVADHDQPASESQQIAPSISPRRGAVYLITGGLGGVGMILAEHLARNYAANIVLIGRDAGIERADLASASYSWPLTPQWDDWFAAIAQRPFQLVEQAHGKHNNTGLKAAMNALCLSHIMAFITQQGLRLAEGQIITRAGFAKCLGITPPLQRFATYFFQVLIEDGVLSASSSAYTVSAKVHSVPTAQEQYQYCLDNYPHFAGMATLLHHCAAQYHQALTGEVLPISVLYPEGSGHLLQQAGDNTCAHSAREALIKLLILAVKKSITTHRRIHQRPFRILELGVGDGVLAQQLIPALADEDIEYCASDISKHFLDALKDKACKADFYAAERTHFSLFDISKSAESQGIKADYFDLIVGLDVVHATANIGLTLDNLKPLLTGEGVLALVESVRDVRWINMIWGLAAGWWCAQDRRMDDSSPLLRSEQWRDALVSAGFRDISSMKDLVQGKEREGMDYDILLARGQSTPQERKTLRLQGMARHGAQVHTLSADVSNKEEMDNVLSYCVQRCGGLDGVIHAAGDTRREAIVNAIAETPSDHCPDVFLAKVTGTRVLKEALADFAARHADMQPEFCFMISSNAATLGGMGLSAYASASAFLDAFAEQENKHGKTTWISSNWDGWPTEQSTGQELAFATSIDRFALSLEECVEAFEKILALGCSQVIVSRETLQRRIDKWLGSPHGCDHRGKCETDAQMNSEIAQTQTLEPKSRNPKSALNSVSQRADIVRELADIWCALLGLTDVQESDSFFVLNGDSLLATQMLAMVKKRFGLALSFRLIFEKPTLGALSDALMAQLKSAALAKSLEQEQEEWVI